MRPSVRGNRALAVLLLLLVAALGALAVMQYRWIDRFAAGERQRRRDEAEFAARWIADALRAEMQRTFRAFRAVEGDDVPQLHDAWMRRAPWPEILETLYSAERTGDTWTLYKLDGWGEHLIETPWPRELEPLRRQAQNLQPRSPTTRWPPVLQSTLPALFIVQAPPEPEREYLHTVPSRVVIVRFSREALSKTIVPALLAQVSAGEPRFDVSLVAKDEVLYTSDASWRPLDRMADASAVIPPDSVRGGRGPEGGGEPPAPRPMNDEPRPRDPSRPRPPDLEILVRHRAGGLESLVAATRRRNIAISAGILAVLLAAIAMLVALLRRGERLRAQEAAFVSVMSHELNTPVAVLRSAGENLKDGIVSGDQVSVYGDTIVQEADRLKHMIGEVLELAGMQARTESHAHRPVAIAPIVEAAVDRCRLVANGAVQIEAEIEPGLPPVAADDDALGRAIQNLIVNAIRHGGAGGWVGVRARREGKRVTITVEDRGPGIHATDLDQVFEPFYRGRGSGSVSGAGLGLTIVKQIAVDHGGSVTLDRREAGAAFTIHLPAEVGRA